MAKSEGVHNRNTQKIPAAAEQKTGAFVEHLYKGTGGSGNTSGKIQQNPIKLKNERRKKNKMAKNSRRINRK